MSVTFDGAKNLRENKDSLSEIKVPTNNKKHI